MTPTGPDAPRTQIIYANHEHYAVLDQPTQSGIIPPPVMIGGLTYLGYAHSIIAMVRSYHPTATFGEIAKRLRCLPVQLTIWIDRKEPITLDPAEWWELLKLRAESDSAYSEHLLGNEDRSS